MAFRGRVVKTYGRLQEKTMKQDNWISPHLRTGRTVSNVFSSPENDSHNASDQCSAIMSSDKENIVALDENVQRKPTRKAARKAKAALEEHVINVNSEGDAGTTKELKTKTKKTGKSRQFSKLSRKYKRVEEEEEDEEEAEEMVISEDEDKTKGRKLRSGKGRTASKPSDLSFDLVFDLTKQKKTSSKSSSESDCILTSSSLTLEEVDESLDLDGIVDSSTPCQVEPQSVGNSLEVKGHITRRRRKREVDGQALRRPKRRHCVVSSQESSFIEDEGVILPRRRLRTRNPVINMSDIARRLSVIELSDDCETSTTSNRNLDPNGLASRLAESSIQELGNGSTDLFEDYDAEAESLVSNNDVKLRSCRVCLTDVSEHSHLDSIAEDQSLQEMSASESCQDKEPLLPGKNQKKSDKFILSTPIDKSISRLALDSFKVALTPTRSKKTGQLLPPKHKVLTQCGQDDFISFSSCLPGSMMKKCVKIGEGVYGEVFRTVGDKRKSVALKIIPIEGDFAVNDENQKTFDEILPEIVISRELSNLRDADDSVSSNFIEVNRVACVRGAYPKKLLDEWDKYDERKTSENERPDMFPDDQLFIIFEFADGGKDLESFEFENVRQAVSVMQQVTGALAAAERELCFEHRDLHWGNVLVGPTKASHVTVTLDGRDYQVESHGLHVSIIDFTLSRLQKDECTVFCDLADDPTLFTGEGDKQFDVYRSMKEHNGNKWEGFHAKTNVFWLEYLLDKLVWEKKYPSDRGQRKVLGQLKSLVRGLGDYCSAEDVFRNSDLMSI